MTTTTKTNNNNHGSRRRSRRSPAMAAVLVLLIVGIMMVSATFLLLGAPAVDVHNASSSLTTKNPFSSFLRRRGLLIGGQHHQQQQRRSLLLSSNNNEDDFPLPAALASLVAQIDNRGQLDTLFLNSATTGDTTLTRAANACSANAAAAVAAPGAANANACTTFSFRGRGVNVIRPLGDPALDWIGKTITGTIQSNGGVSLSLVNNYNDGSQKFPANLSVSTLQRALKSPFSWIYVFGWPFISTISLDDKPSLIVDYRPYNFLPPALDGVRPITRAGLAKAGISVTEPIDDVWVGYLTISLFGIFNLYSHYFVVQFDLDNMTFG
jgi:hypothetical protein